MSNTKRNILLCVGVGTVIVGLVIWMIISNIQKNDPGYNLDINIPTVQIENSTLPDIEKVNIDKEPLMYDFLYGTLNWHTKAPVPALSTAIVYEVCRDVNNNRFYVTCSQTTDSSTGANNWTMPTFGNQPLEVDSFVSDKNAKTGFTPSIFVTDLANYAYTEKEGNFEFSWIWITTDESNKSEGFQTYSSWCNLDLNPFITNSAPGVLNKEIKAGVGIPTKYLRAIPTEVESLAKTEKIFIEDEFWDKINYNCRLKGHKVNHSTQNKNSSVLSDEICWITPQPFSGIAHAYYWDVNDSGDKNLAENLPEYGYQSVEEIIKNESYMSQGDLENYYRDKNKTST